jgi:hypothetical protein
MTVRANTTVRTAFGQVIKDALDSGGAAGYIKIYDGIQPSSVSVVVTTQNILSENTLSYPCATAANGIITFSPISEDSFANNSGIASWARFFNSAGAAIVDASISQIGGGGDLQMNTVNIVQNGPIRFGTMSWTMPGV